jgi:hypothetical protein
MAARIINFQVEDDLRLRLKRVSEESGAPVSWILRTAAERWLDEREAEAREPRGRRKEATHE